MAGFAESYLGRLRESVGDRLLIMPGARIVLEREDGRILLQQRADFGLWGLPGGCPEIGDDLTAAVVREALEEVGVRPRDPQPFGFGSDPAFETVTYPNGHRCQYFVLMYFARSWDGEPRVADDESRAIGWFAPDALPEMLPNMRRSVEAYATYQRTGVFQVI
jgi:ADP-ribose pyrophosphatase YjhB (NUDIX family)